MTKRIKNIHLLVNDCPSDWSHTEKPLIAYEDKAEATRRQKALKKKDPYQNQYVTVKPLRLVLRRKNTVFGQKKTRQI